MMQCTWCKSPRSENLSVECPVCSHRRWPLFWYATKEEYIVYILLITGIIIAGVVILLLPFIRFLLGS